MAINIHGAAVNQTGTLLVSTGEWVQVTFSTVTPGVMLSTSRDDAASFSGMPLPSGSSLTLILSPGSSVWGAGERGSIIGVAVQSLPLTAQLLRLLAR